MRQEEKFRRTNNRATTQTFAGIPHAVLRTRKYASLSGWAVKLLVDVVAQYTGRNNGDLTAAWAVMHPKGWRSKGTLHAACNELIRVGFIVLTRQGGKNRCSLFGITWQPIDECRDNRTKTSKLDMAATTTALGTWKDAQPEPGRGAT